MIDNIYAAVLFIGALLFAYCFVNALDGDKSHIYFCAFYVALLMSDKVWAVRDETFIYGFLKGLLG